MPTARELLEQADALMRRNRQEPARTARESVPPADMRAPVSPIDAGPRVGEPTVPPTPPPTPASASAGSDLRKVVMRAADDAEIPVLDDVIASSGVAASDDDVPLLTDAIDEIELSVPEVDEGEPSDWLTPPSEDESVLGPSPPSIVLVPPAMSGPALPAAGRGQAQPKGTGTAGERPRDATVARVSMPEIDDLPRAAIESIDPDVTVRRALPTLGAPIVPSRVPPPEIEDLAESGLADLDPDVTWTRPLSGMARAATTLAATIRDAVDAEPPSPVELPIAAALDTPARAMPVGGEWDALAEEIRMQVLQRIDLFTDTGLRERLGERLKPIVDRASADLVNAITQHVGELLRAYVAEAIEREIDRWRAGR